MSQRKPAAGRATEITAKGIAATEVFGMQLTHQYGVSQPAAARAAGKRKRRTSAIQAFTFILPIALLGYAIGGRGFAYWGVAPLYIGEVTLLIGLAAAFQSRRLLKLVNTPATLPLLLFCAWGALRTLPYVSRYGVDALRDAVIWGYSMFAVAVASVILARPQWLLQLIHSYAKFAVIFLLVMPVAWLADRGYGGQFPINPITGVPWIEIKGGDTMVHLAGIFCFVVGFARMVPTWAYLVFLPINLGMNIHGRAGMASFGLVTTTLMLLRPFHPRAMKILGVITLGLVVLWAADVRIKDVGGGRELSVSYMVRALSSITSNSREEDLSGTKEWRLRWWRDISDYTINGKYFWGGKGYGINLADDDGYQIDGTLRSPHNGHMTILARSGVPGLALWILANGTWIVTVIRRFFQARARKDTRWSGLFLFLAGYWVAFLVNASFDVFLEGPMAGVWFWSLYGFGLAACKLYPRAVLVLEPPRPGQHPLTGASPIGAVTRHA